MELYSIVGDLSVEQKKKITHKNPCIKIIWLDFELRVVEDSIFGNVSFIFNFPTSDERDVEGVQMRCARFFEFAHWLVSSVGLREVKISASFKSKSFTYTTFTKMESKSSTEICIIWYWKCHIVVVFKIEKDELKQNLVTIKTTNVINVFSINFSSQLLRYIRI